MKKRIIGYDLARALAVFGMVVVNFKIVMGAERGGPEWLATLAGLLDGRAAAVFVVLAGVGISLMTRTGRVAADAERLLRHRRTLHRRALFLFVVGLLYTPLWPADILHFYGVYIAVAAFLLAAPTRRLWASAVGLMLTFVALFIWLDYEAGWKWETLDYSDLWTPLGMLRHLLFNGFHPAFPWLAFLLVGMIIGRQDMGDRAARRRVFGWGAGAAAVAELTSRLLVGVLSVDAAPADQEVVAAVFGTKPMPPLPLYMVAGAGTASAVIAACVELGERFEGAGWLRPLVATGQLALTLYVAHVVLGMGTLEALGRLEGQTLSFALAAAGSFCVAGVVFSHLWRARFERGPLEAAMRRLTRVSST